MSHLRKPIEMTNQEVDNCQTYLPGDWNYDPIENTLSYNGRIPLEMKYVKLLTDYLTSINVEWDAK